jgi:hypothetical protein
MRCRQPSTRAEQRSVAEVPSVAPDCAKPFVSCRPSQGGDCDLDDTKSGIQERRLQPQGNRNSRYCFAVINYLRTLRNVTGDTGTSNMRSVQGLQLTNRACCSLGI